MLRRVINPILFLPLTLSINSVNVLSSETKNYIDNALEEKPNITFVDYQEIEKIILNNHELKKYDWQKPHQENLTGTDSAYYPNKNKNAIQKKYKSWKD